MEKMKRQKKKEKMLKNLTLPSWVFKPQILEKNFPAQDLRGRLDQSSFWLLKTLDFNNQKTLKCQ